MGGSSGAHYGGNAETYMNVGQAMGDAMVELMKADNDVDSEKPYSKARQVD